MIQENFAKLDLSTSIWDRFYTVAPLIVIGTKENHSYNLAPKHMATPLGHINYFGFVCTPKHSTYQNAKQEGFFTVSFPKPRQVILASLAASPRCGDETGEKEVISALPTIQAPQIDAPFLSDAYIHLECNEVRIIDGFDKFSLITGKIIGAYAEKNFLKQSDVEDQELIYMNPLLVYLANGRFAKVRESFAFPFPREFRR